MNKVLAINDVTLVMDLFHDEFGEMGSLIVTWNLLTIVPDGFWIERNAVS